VKTQGRDHEKPLKQRISYGFADEFDRAIKAPMGRKSRLDDRTSGIFSARRQAEFVFQRDLLDVFQGFDTHVQRPA